MHNAKYLGHISKNQLPSATGLDSQKGSPRDLKKVIANLASPQPPVLTFDFIQQRRGRRTLDKSMGLQAAASSSSIINAMVCT